MSSDDKFIQNLESQIKTLGRRRSDLLTQLSDVESKQKELTDRLAAAMLDGGSQRDVERFQNEMASSDSVKRALNIAISEAESRISNLSQQIIERQKEIAFEEYRQIGDELLAGLLAAMAHIVSIHEAMPGLKKTFDRMRDVKDITGVYPANFLERKQGEAFEAFKLLLNWDLSHKIGVFEKEHPVLFEETKARLKERSS